MTKMVIIKFAYDCNDDDNCWANWDDKACDLWPEFNDNRYISWNSSCN